MPFGVRYKRNYTCTCVNYKLSMSANSFKILIFTPIPNISALSNNKVQAIKNIRAFESIQWIFQWRNTASARTITYSQIFHAKMSKQTFHLKIFYLLMLDCKYYFSISPRSNKSGRLNHKSSPHLAGAEFQKLLQPLQRGAKKNFRLYLKRSKGSLESRAIIFP